MFFVVDNFQVNYTVNCPSVYWLLDKIVHDSKWLMMCVRLVKHLCIVNAFAYNAQHHHLLHACPNVYECTSLPWIGVDESFSYQTSLQLNHNIKMIKTLTKSDHPVGYVSNIIRNSLYHDTGPWSEDHCPICYGIIIFQKKQSIRVRRYLHI